MPPAPMENSKDISLHVAAAWISESILFPGMALRNSVPRSFTSMWTRRGDADESHKQGREQNSSCPCRKCHEIGTADVKYVSPYCRSTCCSQGPASRHDPHNCPDATHPKHIANECRCQNTESSPQEPKGYGKCIEHPQLPCPHEP